MSALCNCQQNTKSSKSLLKKIPLKPMAASMIGSALVLYDFIVFGFLASVFSPIFSPTDSRFSAILLGYATFAVGYFCNPIGALIFGHIGDRYGRRVSLSWSLWLMGLSTLLMGVLPSYSRIGILAPVLMVIARMVQGIANGGESTACYIYAMEHTEKSVRGLAGAIFCAGATIGIFLGSLAGFICTLPGMPIWTWRIAFLIGFLVILFGICIRKNIEESPEFNAVKKDEILKSPLACGISTDTKKFFLYILIIGFPGIVFHINYVYLPTFMNSLPGITDSFSRFCCTLSTLIMIVSLPIFGYLADKFGSAKIMKLGAILLSLLLVSMFFNIYNLSKTSILVYELVAAVILSMFNGPSYAFEMTVFDVKHRCSCIGLGFNIAIALLCGTAPLIGAILTNMHNGHLLLGGYLLFWGITGFIGVYGLEILTSAQNIQAYGEAL